MIARAVVSPSAKLGKNVRIGPYAVVGDEVELGDGCVLDAHAVIKGPSTFGRDNHFYSFSIVGGDPQDLTYSGQRVRLEAGDENEFREFCTVHRGTIKGGGVTRVGQSQSDHGLCAHRARLRDRRPHDSYQRAQLAGHIIVEDYATISSFCLLHQFSRVGRYSYIGAGTVITQDVPPFSKVVSSRDTRCFGINKVGLERHGFSPERIKTIEQAYRLLLRSKLNTSQAVEKMRGTLSDSEDVQTLIRFIESVADRGLTK